MLRLGGPLFTPANPPSLCRGGDGGEVAAWISALRAEGYTAAYCPLDSADHKSEIINLKSEIDLVRAYATAAQDAGIVIAEVGAWSNPLSPDPAQAASATERCKAQLDLADRIGARCCVNISGSRGEVWDGPHPANLTDETFDMIVESVRGIIDAVNPTRTFYTLETMPWMYPDSVESYERLIRAIDRKRFAVHFDPANLICSPQRYYASGALISEFVSRLGSHIRSVHLKDVLLHGALTTHIEEVRPGLGGLDYPTLLKELSRLDPDTPLMLEHLSTAEEYRMATDYVRSQAS